MRRTLAVQDAAKGLAALSEVQGKVVFGGYEAVEAIKDVLQKSRDLPAAHGPAKRVIIPVDPDHDEDDGALFRDDELPSARSWHRTQGCGRRSPGPPA
ncbi:hypothetical protein ACU635_35875 [[Actinomadura] parvosata]|uniref:hypothetical protein n=1 Tax=[Actinomadura] parvosata TaxID=1955412 RepID=UPI00406CE52F